MTLVWSECLNCNLKTQVHGGIPARTRDELETRVQGAMMKLQKLPGAVEVLFSTIRRSKMQLLNQKMNLLDCRVNNTKSGRNSY
jgi:hypothetical protein